MDLGWQATREGLGFAMMYEEFVAGKLSRQPSTGLAEVPKLHDGLFEFQLDLVAWALRLGRAAIFADTGLGKTRMQIEWARHVPGDVLILAPLAVAAQTAREGDAIGCKVNVCRELADVRKGVNVTNYDRVHKFDPKRFTGIVLDESSIIKHHDARTLNRLMEMFHRTPFKLCATATPAPNDFTELGTHAEFLGVCRRVEMLSEFFVHDGGDTSVWRLKRHAQSAFWRWVATWAALVRKPSDLGYDDEGYDLPELRTIHHKIEASETAADDAGTIFVEEARSLMDRRRARKESATDRVKAAADLVNASSDPWIVWCDLNVESDMLAQSIPGSTEVRGSNTTDEKEKALIDFAEGRIRVLVTKPSICGFGLNWQHCAHIAFVGVTDSWEAYYQAVRRCWRFGQLREVEAHIFASEMEGAVIKNLARKEKDARAMADELSRETRGVVRTEVQGSKRQTNLYCPAVEMTVPAWCREDQT